MSIGLIGRKVGMTQVFQDDGTMVAVSVLNIEPNTVTRLRTTDRDGYTAVQLGTETSKKLSKPEAGQLKDLPKGAQAIKTIREFRVDSVDDYELGQTVSLVDLFAAGDEVDVSGVSKGKGFAGHIKRHNFHRGPKTHGSDHHREPGSIGPGTTPGRVYRGMMVHMRASNVKLRRRAERMVSRIVGCSEADAARLVKRSAGDVKIAVLLGFGVAEAQAAEALQRHGGNLRLAIRESVHGHE